MTALYFRALVAIAVSLCVLMAGAWVVQQRTCSLGPVGGAAPNNARQWLARLLAPVFMNGILVYVTGRFLLLPQKGAVT